MAEQLAGSRAGRHLRAAGALLALLLAASVAHAIVNGAPASDERFAARFAWAVALQAPGDGGVCSAQLVSPTWVLTAGHCTGIGNRVLVGSSSRALARQVAAVQAIQHPQYDATSGRYDVGLIRLKAPVDLGAVEIVGPAEADALLQEGARAIIAGWGKRSASLSYSDRLVVSDVQMRSLTREESRFAFFDPVSGPCGGDSGGPLLLSRNDGTWVLAGVASRVMGDICAQGGGISIYLDVSSVREFILAHVHDLPSRKLRHGR